MNISTYLGDKFMHIKLLLIEGCGNVGITR